MMRGVRSLTAFRWWAAFRSWVMPALIVVALVAVVISGGLAALHDRYTPITAALLTAHLIAAALLTLMHAAYLVLMSHHLVYRHRVDDIDTVAVLVYCVIALAYGLHAVHGYLEAAGHSDFLFATPAWTFGAFGVAYVILFGHGLKEKSEHPERPHTRNRARFMLGVDGLMVLMLVYLVFSAGRNWHHTAPELERTVETGASGSAGILRHVPVAVWHQATGKDLVVAVALILFGFVRLGTEATRRKRERSDNEAMLKDQTTMWANIAWTPSLPPLPQHEVVWLHFGGRPPRGIVRALNNPLY